MPHYDLFGDQSGLPRTKRGDMPYEIEALSPKEIWGHGHGSTTLVCRQTWTDAAQWIRYMVGEVTVQRRSNANATPKLVRHLPEPLRYNESGDGADQRTQFCTGVSQTEQGGNEGIAFATPEPMAQEGTYWPKVEWCKYMAVWETMPYWVRTEAEMDAIAAAANAGPTALAGARELYRYVVRKRKNYTKEQPIPAATTAGGFKVIDDAVAANRKPIGQVGFRVVSMADVSYTWVRIPVGWPPPVGFLLTDTDTWPPLVNPIVADPTIRRTRDSFLGTINSTWFDAADPEGYGFRAGELLYVGYDDDYKYFDAAGDRVMDITLHFKFKEGGWNRFLSATGEWKEVSLTGLSTGTKPYQTNDFNDLFQAT